MSRTLTRRRSRLLKIALGGAFLWVAHTLWQPGLEVRDGRDNHNQNALWMGHGWLGDDAWFAGGKYAGQQGEFRSSAKIRDLALLCEQNGVSDVFPHLAPSQPSGAIAGWNDAQIERFLSNTPKLRVLPWIGGRLDGDARAGSKEWRTSFTTSVKQLLKIHPRLAGVHLNIEPWNSGDADALVLLDELRAVLPQGKILSVSAYPPSDWFFPFRRGWTEEYFKQVAARSDQMALMAYDSSVHDSKLFQWFVARWTRSSLDWAATSPRKTRVLVGIPTYADAGTTWGAFYHNGRVENVHNSLMGIHRGLSQGSSDSFQGVAVYSEWETSADEWASFRREWGGKSSNSLSKP